ncbi:hypothetical protein ACGFLT_24110 [Micromonospora chalcea]
MKVVLSNAPVTPPAVEPDQPGAYRYEEPAEATDVEPVRPTVPTSPVVPAVLPPRAVQPNRPHVVGIIR